MCIKTNTNTNTIVLLLLCTCTSHTLCEKHFYSKENEKQITKKKQKTQSYSTCTVHVRWCWAEITLHQPYTVVHCKAGRY